MKSYFNPDNIKYLTGLIGSPVSHSLSPSLFKIFYFQNKMDEYRYVLIDSSVKGLEQTINSLDERFVGFNVTMPDKINIIDYLDELSSEARAIGSVNTVKIKEGKLIGYNTDGKGFVNALMKNNVKPENKNVVIFGAGGASKAISYELGKLNANIKILHRPQKEELNSSLENCDIFINASPVGMDGYSSPVEKFDNVKKDLFVADLIYHPSQTILLKKARLACLKTMNGYDMLYEQAKLSFDIFHN